MRLKQIVSKCRFSENTLRPYPAIPFLCLYLSTSIPLGMWDFGYCARQAAIAALLFLPLICLFIFPRPFWISGLVVALIGFLMTWLHIEAPWRSYEDFLVRDEVYAEVKAVVSDNHIIESESLAEFNKTRNIEITLQQLRLSRFEKWNTCRGKVYLLNPEDGLQYGSVLYLKGKFVLPWKNELPDIFNYRNHLKSKGICHLFRAEEVQVERRIAQGWRKAVQGLIRMRENVLHRILRNVGGTSNRKALAAMTMGFRKSLDHREREVFLKSGMIHILAISGLHIGILYAILMTTLNLLRLPFSFRHYLGPLILLIYILATGAAASALRAWIMLSLWSIGRGLKLPVVPINTVAAAAFILLLYNPFYMFQSGFQFSFVVVVSLVAGWKKARVILDYLGEKEHWIPNARSSASILRQGLTRNFIAGLLSMASATLGSAGLTAYYNFLVLPSSIISNLLVGFVAWLILTLGIVKLLVSYFFVSWPEFIVGQLLTKVLDLLMFIAEISYEYGGSLSIPRPLVFFVIFYYLILFIFLTSRLNLQRFFSISFLLISVLSVCFSPIGKQTFRPERNFVLLAKNCIVPVIVKIASEQSSEVILINTGTFRFGNDLKSWLKAQGVHTIGKVIIFNNRAHFLGGIDQILKEFKVGTCFVVHEDNRKIRQLKNLTWQNGARLRLEEKDDHDKFEFCGFHLLIEKTQASGSHYKLYNERDGFHGEYIQLEMKPYEHCNLERTSFISQENRSMAKNWKFIYSNKNIVERF